mgnify:CR=1 FL=1
MKQLRGKLSYLNTTKTKHLEADNAHIKKACIEEMTCDTKFTGHPKFENLTADKVITKNITSQ